MGFIFQDFALIPSLTCTENVTYPLIPRGMPQRGALSDRPRTAVSVRHGRETGRTRPRVERGEQQRVAICRALAGRPEVVVADEPTSSLDAGVTGALLGVFEELRAEGKTVVASSHDPAEGGGRGAGAEGATVEGEIIVADR